MTIKRSTHFKYQLFVITWLFVLQMIVVGAVQSQPPATSEVKELNFVFTHGAAGTACGTQLLSDIIVERLPLYVRAYEVEHPGVELRINAMNRCYPVM